MLRKEFRMNHGDNQTSTIIRIGTRKSQVLFTNTRRTNTQVVYCVVICKKIKLDISLFTASTCTNTSS